MFFGQFKDFLRKIKHFHVFGTGLGIENVSNEEREAYKKNYALISEAIGNIFTEGKISQETHQKIWKARDQARLELCDEIKNYTEEIFLISHEAFSLYYSFIAGEHGLPKGPERTERVNQFYELIKRLNKFEPHKKYRPYIQY